MPPAEEHIEELIKWAREEQLEENPKRLTKIYREARKRFAQYYSRSELGLMLERVLRGL